MNVANIKHAALRRGIKKPLALSLDQLIIWYRECKEYTKWVVAEAPSTQKKFLTSKLQDAVDEEKEAEARQISNILRKKAHNNAKIYFS